MFRALSTWLHPRSAARAADGRRPPKPAGVRPRLEALEDRVSPAVVTYPTATSLSFGQVSFALFTLDQTETVTVQTRYNFPGGTGLVGVDGTVGSPLATVAISDGGQTQTVGLNASGQATATFHFNILQELQNGTWGPHNVTANYSGTSLTQGATKFVWQPSSGSGSAPGDPTGFYAAVGLDVAIAAALALGVAAASQGATGG